MNITIIIGWVLAFGLTIFGILSGGQIGWFIDPASVLITVGGTFGGLIASFPLSTLANLPKLFKIALFPPKYNPQKYIDEIVEYARVARSQGILTLEDSANKAKDPFMKKSLLLLVDANDTEKIREMLEEAISFTEDRHAANKAFFEKGVALGPAFGMLGTLVGLVNMLMKMNESGDLGSAMATALITTFYGSLIANVIFGPLASALENANNSEILCMQIICQGAMAIAAGFNPALIREKLEFMLADKDIKHAEKSGD
ncbi:MAG: MotA/TolQ/ExbB proton channel family protein [Firmicutes bacterium]|nr:MotA/TolQ/ExbB proton channel family protein [[Eubacterium] siraeum]MCM1486943.1 MotA/TolQ/ExbB proton channel family protein [Bacillota bacterium]